MNRTLLLNASFEPLRVISWQRAVTLLCRGKVEVVESYNRTLRAVSWALQMPSVVRLTKYIRRSRVRIAMTRQNLLIRDDHQCQYCLNRFPARDLTRDHVIPRSRGGQMTWENIVTACGPCNRSKGGRTPVEARMCLLRPPKAPEGKIAKYLLNLGSQVDSSWQQYLAWNS